MIHDYYRGMIIGVVSGLFAGTVLGLLCGGMFGFGYAHREIEFEHLLGLGEKVLSIEREIWNQRKPKKPKEIKEKNNP